MIDHEVRKLIDGAYANATKILKEKKKEWFALAQGLLEYKTLTGAEINEVISGKPPSRSQKDETSSVRTSSVPKTRSSKREPDKVEEVAEQKEDKEETKNKKETTKSAHSQEKGTNSNGQQKKTRSVEKKDEKEDAPEISEKHDEKKNNNQHEES